MSKRRTHTTYHPAQRGITTLPLTPLLTPSIHYLNLIRRSRLLTQSYREHQNENRRISSVIDRRRYHPDRIKPAGATKRNATRLVTRGPYSVAFAIPARVAVCAKRKTRREVLHAYRLTGSAGLGRRKRRRNFWSDVRC